MITIEKDKFKVHMEHIVKLLDMQSKFDDITRGTYGTRFECELMFPTLVEDVIELLQDATHDQDDNISYFLFEIDCGRKWKPGMITMPDGTDIPVATIDDLWNILVDDEKRREAKKGGDE